MRGLQRLAFLAVAILGLMCFAAPSQAQTVRFKSSHTLLTEPLGYIGTATITNLATVSGLGGNTVNYTVSGLPITGVTYTLTDTNGHALTSTTMSTNLWLNLTFDGNEAEGLATISLIGTGTTTNSTVYANNILIGLQVADFWAGPTNSASNWSVSGSWNGNNAPNAHDVVFGPDTAPPIVFTNSIVDQNFTIGSLRFSPTNSTSKFDTLLINSGVTLTINGANGFSMLKDYPNFITGLGGMTVTIAGGTGTMVVSNETANINSIVDNGNASALDLSGLGTFVSDVNQIGIGDTRLWPFFRNYQDQNNYAGQPRQSLTTINLARTNIIKAVFADPYQYTNSDSRYYSLSWMNSELTGSSTAPNFNLGISNIFYIDSINLIGGNSRGNMQFNSAFAASNSIAIFRGTNGGRMSMYSQADGGGTNTANSNIKSTISFQSGSLDMLVDRFYIGRDRVKIVAAGTPNYQGNFFMGKGIIDANTVILGFREHPGEATNASYAYNGYCEGTVAVTNGVFKVNNSLTLGYTKETNPNGLGSGGNTEYGQFTLVGGATLLANTIYVGGPVYMASKNNFITVSNNSTLVVSNTVGSVSQMLDLINFANGSTLAVNLSATNTAACIYSTNFNMVGSNTLIIAAIRNPGSLSDGMKIPLFKRTAGGAPNFTLINNSGVNGQIVTDGSDANQQDFQVILSTPKNLLWKGYSSADWDNTTENWLDLSTSLHTNFAAGDNVTFDDTASQFNINLSSAAVILPGSVTMTNTTWSYIINNSSGGRIIGSATLTKTGSNSLEIDGPTSITIQLNQGTLTGSGSIGSAVVSSGAVMNFSGTVLGNLSPVLGVATCSGTVNGAVNVQSGGVVTNNGTMNSTFGVSSGGLFVNNPGASLANVGTSSSVSAGGVFFNRGNISGVNVTVGGTFKDTGEGATTLTGTFTANSSAIIIPGGDVIGNMKIQSGTASGNPGRVLLSQGSTNIFKVDPGTLASSVIYSGFQDFGGSASARSQNGCTIVITNVTGAPFANGQQFTMFQYYDGGGNPTPTGTSTNTYPVIVPASPGPGLAWDLTQLWPSGVIGVMNVSAAPTLMNSFAFDSTGTNFIGQFSWPSTNLGWRLVTQVNPLSVGLSTNWSNVSPPSTNTPVSWATTTYMLTNTIGTNINAVFYRLSFP